MKKLNIFLQLAIILIGALTLIALNNQNPVFAIDPSFKPINTPFHVDKGADPAGSFIRILQIIAGGLLYFAAPLAVILITITGLEMNVYGADSEKSEQAKKSITWLIVGLVLIMLSYSLVKFIIWISYRSAGG